MARRAGRRGQWNGGRTEDKVTQAAHSHQLRSVEKDPSPLPNPDPGPRVGA